ncbi:MAG: DHH family phosphoesterase [Oscillospiraceae bacterium]|nr:DHH family phosphoesterase [Oscillospiraceae bacterium]
MQITLEKTCELLSNYDNIRIVCHKFPDGDTIGSAYALCMALRKLGKTAGVFCVDEISPKFAYFTDACPEIDFEIQKNVCVDVADRSLIGTDIEKIDLIIDHHASHREFSDNLYLKNNASNAENIIDIINILGVEWDPAMASAVYTGISTDTGCFRFPNTTPASLRAAADMIELGAESSKINTAFFETKSKIRIEVEGKLLNGIEYFFDGQVAFAYIGDDILSIDGITEDDLDGISSLPRAIEGVKVGATLRKRPDGYKISVRTDSVINASAICEKFGGGGHKGAAGCNINADIDKAKSLLLDAIKDQL